MIVKSKPVGDTPSVKYHGAKPTGGKGRVGVILGTIVFFLVLLCIVVFMNVKNTADLRSILTESIKSQLTSITIAAREIIDVNAFDGYNKPEDALADMNYNITLAKLRQLRSNVGAEYIYALKQVDGVYIFVFDTDEEANADFQPYDLSPVHESAFLGKVSAGVMNVTDEFGSFNTGAVPIWKDGKVIGIISTDIRDTYLKESNAAAQRNTIILIATLVITMAIMLWLVITLLTRVQQMRARLEQIAHYDTVTGLPNRQYLLDYLAKITAKPDKPPFALLFIDLDNFKKVNDNAGHDAGDELLRSIANYLQASQQNAMSFRPSAGILNIAARIGGDEFIQIVSGISNEAEAATFAHNLLTLFHSQSNNRYVEKYQVGLSIGIALFPYHSDNFHVLIKYADIAMYHSKGAGKNCFRIYNDEMQPAPEK